MRIAQEVHDVVGHRLAAINMQAGIARHVFDRRPEQVQPALESITNASKEALDELRATLAMFREPDDFDKSPAPRHPAPTLTQLDQLTASTGLPVTVTITGDQFPLPTSVDLAAYRIVQEALTNILHHAGHDARAIIHVDYRPDAVSVEVTDDGQARPTDSPPPHGSGIPGMRERAASVGGTLDAGPRAEGGFRVQATLPTS